MEGTIVRSHAILLGAICGLGLAVGGCSDLYQSLTGGRNAAETRESRAREEWRKCLEMKRIDPDIDCSKYGIKP